MHSGTRSPVFQDGEMREIARRANGVAANVAAVILGTATFACIQGELTGYRSGWVIILFIVSFLTVPIFYLAEKGAKSPMLELGFFRRKSFTGSAFIAFASYFSIFSIFFFVALYLEVVTSLSAYGLALDFLPLLGGIVLGELETLGGTYLPFFTNGALGTEYKDIFGFLVLVLLLLVRPQGLLGKSQTEKV